MRGTVLRKGKGEITSVFFTFFAGVQFKPWIVLKCYSVLTQSCPVLYYGKSFLLFKLRLISKTDNIIELSGLSDQKCKETWLSISIDLV